MISNTADSSLNFVMYALSSTTGLVMTSYISATGAAPCTPPNDASSRSRHSVHAA